MSVQWSASAPHLLVRLDPARSGTLGSQLQEELRLAIRSGRLGAGERLPSSRILAAELGVSRGLVQSAYEQLGAEGYLNSRPGSGTLVALAAASPSPARHSPAVTAAVDVDFSPGRPDLRSFPMRDWLWSWGEVSRTAPVAAAGYQDPRGQPRLREVLSAYLRRVRGAVAGPDDVVICNGYSQGAALTLAVLAGRGVRQVAVEDPGHPAMKVMVERAGLEAIPVPVDRDGVDVAALAATGARAVMLTPAHHTPTGALLSAPRRQLLMQWAAERDAFIIEDDYDAEFRYDRKPVGSLQGLGPARVFSIVSFSKSLAPALRLGAVLVPRQFAAAMAQEKNDADRGSPGLDQLALASLIESGRFDRHLRRMRTVYAGRRATLVGALRTYAPGVSLTGLPAGFHAVAALPDSADEAEVIRSAAERSVRLQGLNHYRFHHGSGAPGIVFGFGDVSDDAIVRGVAAVADLFGG